MPTDSRLLAHLRALDTQAHAESPPTPDDMVHIGEYDPETVENRFGSWDKALAQAGIIRDPDKPPKVPTHVKSRAKNVAGHRCEMCGVDATDPRTGLSVEWVENPDDPSEATVGDVQVVCDECGG